MYVPILRITPTNHHLRHHLSGTRFGNLRVNNLDSRAFVDNGFLHRSCTDGADLLGESGKACGGGGHAEGAEHLLFLTGRTRGREGGAAVERL